MRIIRYRIDKRIAMFRIPRRISNIVRLWEFIFTSFPRAVTSVSDEPIKDNAIDCNFVIRFKSDVCDCFGPV